jgi:hypothetical protein
MRYLSKSASHVKIAFTGYRGYTKLAVHGDSTNRSIANKNAQVLVSYERSTRMNRRGDDCSRHLFDGDGEGDAGPAA